MASRRPVATDPTIANELRDSLSRAYKEGGKPVVFCVLRKASASGMSREIGFFVFTKTGPHWLNYYISELIGLRRGKNDGLIVSGAGMDMGFHIVSAVSRKLFDDDYSLKSVWI